LVLTPADAGTIAEEIRSHLENHTQLTTRQYFLVSSRAPMKSWHDRRVAVPTVPADVVINWRKAVHSKAIGLSPGRHPQNQRRQALVEELAAMQWRRPRMCARVTT